MYIGTQPPSGAIATGKWGGGRGCHTHFVHSSGVSRLGITVQSRGVAREPLGITGKLTSANVKAEIVHINAISYSAE